MTLFEKYTQVVYTIDAADDGFLMFTAIFAHFIVICAAVVLFGYMINTYPMVILGVGVYGIFKLFGAAIKRYKELTTQDDE